MWGVHVCMCVVVGGVGETCLTVYEKHVVDVPMMFSLTKKAFGSIYESEAFVRLNLDLSSPRLIKMP